MGPPAQGRLWSPSRRLTRGLASVNWSNTEALGGLPPKLCIRGRLRVFFAYGGEGVDVVVVPTTPTHWTVEEMLGDPTIKNIILGKSTHCGNVLDLCGIAVPAGIYAVSRGDEDTADATLPFGTTFLGGLKWTQRHRTSRSVLIGQCDVKHRNKLIREDIIAYLFMARVRLPLW